MILEIQRFVLGLGNDDDDGGDDGESQSTEEGKYRVAAPVVRLPRARPRRKNLRPDTSHPCSSHLGGNFGTVLVGVLWKQEWLPRMC